MTASEAAHGIYGAYRLARGDKSGLLHMDLTADGAWRSLRVILWLLVPYLLVVLMSKDETYPDAALSDVALASSFTFIISWVGYLNAVWLISQMLGHGERFAAYVVAYNWAAVLIGMGMLAIVALVISGMLGQFGFLVYAISSLAVLVYVWFIAKAVLTHDGLQATALTVVWVFIEIIVQIFQDWAIAPVLPS